MLAERRYSLIICIFSLMYVFACGCGERSAGDRPNVILITIDAVSIHHLSCFGYDRPTSPNLDRLAQQNVFFTKARSSSSWTAPAMAGLFSGMHSRSHGIRHGLFNVVTHKMAVQEKLAGEIMTLAETLKKAGYHTMGLSSNPHMRHATGFAQGFDDFEEHTFITQKVEDTQSLSDREIEKLLVNAEFANGKVREIISRRPENTPYFLWVHYIDPHWPYFPKEPWISEYYPGGRKEDVDNLYNNLIYMKLKEFNIKKGTDIFNYITACYDSEINFCDKHMGQLLEFLPGLNDSLLIVTADHGESFFEHQFLGHRNSLYDEELRIPLIVRFPENDRRQAVVDAMVSLLDIPPTILDYLGLKQIPEWQGESLLPIIEGREKADPVFAEFTDFEDKESTSVSTNRWKMILKDGREPELYDLISDREEQRNLYSDKVKTVEEMEKLLRDWENRIPYRESEVNSDILHNEIKVQLKALGYVAEEGELKKAEKNQKENRMVEIN